ncbi:4Fe-4S binding protein [Fusobacterium sp.]|uniref:4Fe-4S binding protein n=1 Tax=Fusobacterium sp. TaxID=68766 RepID=UPI0025C6A9DE|nr:4Fe-4S binding protein [Fusobacterium sp.]
MALKPEDIKRVKALGFLHNKGTEEFSVRVITENGVITAAQNTAISEVAEKFGAGRVSFTSRLTVEIPGINYNDIEAVREYFAKYDLVTGGTGSKVRPVVACKGTTCNYGLCDTQAIATEIHKRFFEGYADVKLPHKFKIAVGGCPNNCVKPDLNDIGIIGQRVPKFDEDLCSGCKKCAVENVCPMKAAKVVDGILEIDKDLCNNCGLCVGKCHFDAIEDGDYGFKIYIGGRWGKKIAHGIALRKVFTSKEEALSVIEKAILLFREQGKTGERFAATIERIGFDNVEAQLLVNDLLDRKQEIIDAKLHLVGGATC